MKKILSVLMLLISISANAQFEWSVSIANGISKQKNNSFNEGNGTTHSFVYSGGINTLLKYNTKISVRPLLGISFYSIGNKLTIGESHPNLGNEVYDFRFNYLQIPIGLSATIFKSFELGLFAVNGIQVSDNKSEALTDESKIYEFALKPFLNYKLNNWQIGVEYYHGLTDVFGLQEPEGDFDLRYLNRAIYFTIGYTIIEF